MWFIYRCFFFFSIGISICAAQGGKFDCPPPWIDFEDKCYKFELFQDTIQGAKDACQRDGASLLSVNSLPEHEFVAGWLSNNAVQGKDWYTSGIRDTNQPDKFNWQGDGTTIENFQHWLNDDVRTIDKGNRLLYGTFGAAWGWKVGKTEDQATGNDIKRPYICEIGKSQIYKIISQDRGYEYGTLETDSRKFETGPIFIEQPEDAIFDKDSVEKYSVLECVADSNPRPTYTWYKTKEQQRLRINPLEDTRLTVTNGKLTINQPNEPDGDNADYDCVAENKLGAIRSISAQLSFGYLNDFPKSVRDPVTVDAFSGIGLECSPPTHGYPSLLYSWFRDTVNNFVRPELKPYTFISGNGKLYFSAVTRDDQGEYYCLVSSPYTRYSFAEGKVSMPIALEVKEGVGSEKEPQMASGFPAVFPSSPLQGENVKIECFAFGTNELFYSWEKVGGPLPVGAKLTDHNRVLIIPNIQVIHGGTYKCSVSRWQGLTASAEVEVPVEAAPYFTINLKNQHVDVGSDLTWIAIADGIPSVKYTWYKNAEKLVIDDLDPQDKNRYSIQSNVLTITGLDPDRDAGMYQLAAENSHGIQFSSAQLRILSFPPSFTKYPLQQRQYATLRGNATLICQPEAAPTATKEWRKNNVPMNPSKDESSRIYELPNGNLVIQRVQQSDEGTYTCAATNRLGEASSSGTFKVLPTTTLSQPPINTVVQVNKTAIFQCQASFNPTLDITYDWYHNDRKIEFIKIRIIGEVPYIEREDYFERGSGINRGALYIHHTQYFHAGLYTCVVMTNTEAIKRSAELYVIGPPFPPIGITGSDVTTTTIKLSWNIGIYGDNGRQIQSYIIEGQDLKEGFWKRIRSNLDTKDLTTTITGLSPFSKYMFRVRAENSLGIGDPSKESETYTTDSAPPEVYPTNVGRCINKVGTLCITWDKIPEAQQNGEGFGYIVKFKKSYIIDEEYTIETISGADTTRFVALVGQSNFYQEYDVTVAGFNNKGIGPDAPEITIRSAMGIPTGQATQLRVWQHNATALLAEWDPVQNTIAIMKGTLLGYRINYWRDCCETEEMAIFNQVAGQRISGMIIGLYPDTKYTINVQVYNEAGYGPKTDDLYQETLRAAPMEAPQEVHVFVEGSTSLRVKWRGVSTGIQEEPLEGYRVRFWKQTENRYLAEDREAYKKTEIVVSDLEVDTYYELRVFGYSRGGDGLMSSPIIQFILGPNCYIREDSPEKRYIYKCRGETDGASYLQFTTLISVVMPLVLQIVLMYR